MTGMQKSDIENLIASGETERAETEVLAMLNAASTDRAKSEALFLLGRVAWKRGDKAAAISRYNDAVALDADSEAAVALQQALDIMDFFNKDLYNP